MLYNHVYVLIYMSETIAYMNKNRKHDLYIK